jgi:hypothetical protein
MGGAVFVKWASFLCVEEYLWHAKKDGGFDSEEEI